MPLEPKSEEIDILLCNGTFITMENSMPLATALAIKGKHIAWVGDQRDSNSWIGSNTEIIDLKGAFVYPGFIDSHAHIPQLGMIKHFIHLEGIKNKQTVLQKIKEHVKSCQKGEWIFGIGWDEGLWPEKVFPTAFDLDEVAPNNPVVLRRIDAHSIWVNSYVLNVADIQTSTADPEGGKIYRDNLGRPTGIFSDTATLLVENVMPVPSLLDMHQFIQETLQEAIQEGITTIHNAFTLETDFEAFKSLADKNALAARVYLMARIPSKLGETTLQEGPQSYGPFLGLRCLKFFMDGTLGSRGSALLEPYSDDSENRGLLIWNESEIMPILKKAKDKGLQVAIHAIGDRASHYILNLYEKIGVKGLRWRIEHAQLLTQSDIKRFAELGVIAAMQPSHATTDMDWLAKRVGNERIQMGGFAWRSLLDHGTIIAGGSDAPIGDLNPLWGIYAAITRQNHQGFPKEGWYPEQRVTHEEALKMYTVYAAYAGFHEDELGSLKQGKLADLVILPENLLTCDPKAMIDMKVLYTIVNGKISFKSI